MSLEDTLKSVMAYIATLDEMDRVKMPLVAQASLVQYLGLQRWMALPSDAFNVTAEEMERNRWVGDGKITVAGLGVVLVVIVTVVVAEVSVARRGRGKEVTVIE